MSRFALAALTLALAAAVAVSCAHTAGTSHARAPRILFLSKSEGFEHSVVAEHNGQPSLATKTLEALCKKKGYPFKSTKDASLINADNLKNYDLVILYTQGDLTKPSKDGGAPMSEKGQADLVEWVKNGGRVLGFHSASDTFHTPKDGEITPYLKMMGGEFVVHGKQFAGTVKVVDPKHPTLRSIPQDWNLKEEWYTFKNFDTGSIRVLALMDPGEERAKQDMYNTPAYPIIWVNAVGAGKVYFTALGHREQVWADPIFQNSILDTIKWLMKPGAEGTQANFEQVVPKK